MCRPAVGNVAMNSTDWAPATGQEWVFATVRFKDVPFLVAAPPSARPMRFARLVSSRGFCPRTRKTRRPSARNSRRDLQSRARLYASFCFQKSAFGTGGE